MRTILRAGVGLVFLAAAYWGWALVGAAQLASAASHGDAEAVMRRVDLPALTRSLGRQISAAFLAQNPQFQKLQRLDQGFVRSAGADAANAVLREMLTPETIAALLSKGAAAFPGLGASGGGPAWRAPSLSEAFESNVWAAVAKSRFDGPLSFVVALEDAGGRYRVHLHLSGATWRLSGLDIPEAVSARLAREISQRVG